MHLNSLSMKNFKKYRGWAKVEFQDGLTGIVGRNGSGKSTIVEAIAWALYGSRASTVRRDFIKNSRASESEDLEVRLSLNVDGQEMTIQRAMRGKSLSPEARLKIDGDLVATGTREVDAHLESILKISFSDFMKTFYARQKDLDNLIKDRGSEKREYLLTLLGLDEVRERALDEIRSDLREVEGEIGRLEGALAEIGDVGEAIGLREGEVASLRVEMTGARGLESNLSSELEKRREELEIEADLRRSFERLNEEMGRLRSDIEDRRRAVFLDEKRLEEIEEGRWRLFELEPKLARLGEAREKLEELEPKRSRHQGLLERRVRIRANLDGRNHALSEAELRLERLLAERSELETIRPAEEDYRSLLPELEAIEEKRDRHQKLFSLAERERARKEAAEENVARVEETLRGLEKAKIRMAEIAPSLERHKSLQEEISRLEREKEKKKRLFDLEKRAAAVRSRIDAFREKAESVDEEVSRLGDLEERETDLKGREKELDRQEQSLEEKLAGLNLKMEVSRRELGEARRQRAKIEALGEESLCPTCERPLAGQRHLLLEKYQTAASAAEEKISSLEDLRNEALARLEGAAKSREALKSDLALLVKARANRGELLAEKRGLEARISEQLDEAQTIDSDMKAIGPVKYDPDEHECLGAEAESLLTLVQEHATLLVRIEELPKKRKELEELSGALERSIGNLKALADQMAKLGYSEDQRLLVRERISALRPDHQRFSALEQRVEEIPDLEEAARKVEAEVERLQKEEKEVGGEIEKLGFNPAEYKGLVEEVKALGKAEAAANEIKLALAAEGEVRRHLEESMEVASRLEVELTEAEGRLSDLDFSDERYSKARTAMEEAAQRLEEARARASRLSVRLGVAEADLKRLRGDASRKRELEEKVAERRRRVQVVETTRSLTNRFMDQILVRIRSEIAINAGRILREVTGKYGRISIDDDFGILVEDEGEFYPISRYSGGEIDMIAVSVRVAISERLMRFSQNGPSYSFLILDEIFGSQDVEHRESMISMLRSLDDRFPQIFAISHIGEVQGQFDNSILVIEEEDGSSRIEVELR
jgi:exonuclease SbcC